MNAISTAFRQLVHRVINRVAPCCRPCHMRIMDSPSNGLTGTPTAVEVEQGRGLALEAAENEKPTVTGKLTLAAFRSDHELTSFYNNNKRYTQVRFPTSVLNPEGGVGGGP